MDTSSFRMRLRRGLLASFLASVWIGASAADAGGDSTGPGRELPDYAGHQALVVQLDYVVPQYRGGDKFRSPATIDTALAEDLARRLQRAFAATGPASQESAGNADLQLTTLRDHAAVPPGFAVIPVGYRAAPMAIMRTDTTIRRWEHLQGRKVCVAQGGNHVGTTSGRYGATEQVHPSVTDALVALRTGGCDAMVHDSPMLEALLRFTEWRKFSAQLRSGRRSSLAFLVPAEDKESVSLLSRVADEWRSDEVPDALVKNAVRNMAFEVYLEQDVPDCH